MTGSLSRAVSDAEEYRTMVLFVRLMALLGVATLVAGSASAGA